MQMTNLKTKKNNVKTTAFEINIIYCFTKENNLTQCKIGKTSIEVKNGQLPTEQECKEEAEKRKKEIFGTAGVNAKLEYVWIAIKQGKSFTDNEVHRYLINVKGIKKIDTNNIAREWFKCTPQEAKIAIDDFIKDTNEYEKYQKRSDFKEFREEQKVAIEKTYKFFKKIDDSYETKHEFLWDCVMRFGKTISAYGFIQKCIDNKVKCDKILILSHYPEVNTSWKNDFHKFQNDVRLKNYLYGSSNGREGLNFDDIKNKNYYFYFCSIQKLRRKNIEFDETEEFEMNFENNGFAKNNQELFQVDWDLVIIDEGHEGTLTQLAQEMIDNIKTKMFLYLSGTPFKLLATKDKFSDDNVFIFSYLDERAKCEEYAEKIRKGEVDENPYEDLPRLQIIVQTIGEDSIDKASNPLSLSESGFSFKEFFEVDKKTGNFKNENDVINFLDKLCNKYQEEKNELMPFSAKNYFNNRHSLWWINNVDTAKALEKLLRSHDCFKRFKVINAAGGNDDGTKKLKELKKAINDIKENHEDNCQYEGTITLTFRRLTTGVTVPEWSCVLMLNESTSAQAYFQTAFRAKTQFSDKGIIKRLANIYDFNPDRLLQIIPQILGENISKSDNEKTKKTLGEFLNAAPIIVNHGNTPFYADVDKIMQEMKTIYARKIVDSGFTSEDVFDKDKLINDLNEEEILHFEKLFNKTSKSKPKTSVKIVENNIPLPKKEKIEGETIKKIFDFSTKWDKKTQNIKKYFENDNQLREFLKGKNIILDEVDFGFVENTKNKKFWIKAKNTSEHYTGEATVAFVDDSITNFKQHVTEITSRMPLLILALPLKDISNFSLEKFCSEETFDDESWFEFMKLGSNPKESREAFKKIIKFLDKDAMCKSIQLWNNDVNNAFNESLTFDDAYKSIMNLLKRVKNPDKETVLTPEKVVNLHFDNSSINWNECEGNEFTIIDINSKSGIYPLYATHKIYQILKEKYENDISKYHPNDIILKHIYVMCRTNAAKLITRKILGLSSNEHDKLANEHIIQFDLYENLKDK